LLQIEDAAKRIRHWHDSEPDGMVVSSEHVRKLWAALQEQNDGGANLRPVQAPGQPEGIVYMASQEQSE